MARHRVGKRKGPSHAEKFAIVHKGHQARLNKVESVRWHSHPYLDRTRPRNIHRQVDGFKLAAEGLFPDREHRVPDNDPIGHTLLPNSVALQGKIREFLPNHPRSVTGEIMPLIDMSMGSYTAGADLSTAPVGVQQSAMPPGRSVLLHKIPTSASF